VNESIGQKPRPLTGATWIGLLAVCAAFACSRGDGPRPPPPPEVTVARARLGSVPDQREYVGNVRATNRIELRARVRGYLLEQLFSDGERVEAGELLFQIDPKPFEVTLAEAKGQLARARANAVRAERDLARAQELFDGHVISISALDQRRAERDITAAEVEAASASVRAAEVELSYCSVHAPIGGRMTRAFVDVGNLVGESGQDTILAELVQEDPVHVYFAPTERDRLDVMRGAREGRIPTERTGAIPIRLQLGDGRPYPHEGVVDYVDPTVEPTRGTVTVRALLPNPEGELKPGEFVRVIAVFPDVTDAVLIPRRAILDEQGGHFVLVVGEDETVAQRTLQLGTSYDGMQQIAEGLEVGERVIVDGVQKVRPGDAVVARALPAETDLRSDGSPPAP
jgi:RND family efflux transporter MFP subunit